MLNLGHILILIVAFCLPLNAQAGKRLYEPDYHCPRTHTKYEEVLAKLDSLKSKLDQLHCQNISLNLGEISKIVTKERGQFVKIIKANKDSILSAEDAEKVRGYATKVSEKVSNLVAAVSTTEGPVSFSFWAGNDQQCRLGDTDKYEILNRTSSLVYDATNLISQVAGPYGVPIAIGGNVLSGIISGVGSFMKTMNAGEDQFNQREKRNFYSQTLCLFHQLDNEVESLINNGAYIEALESLQNHLDKSIEVVQRNCMECSSLVEKISQSDEEAPKLLQKVALQIDETYSDNRGSDTKKFLTSLHWVREEIDRYQEVRDFPTEGLGPADVQDERNKIKHFLIDKTAPQFIRWFLYTEFKNKEKKLDQKILEMSPELLPKDQRIKAIDTSVFRNRDEDLDYATKQLYSTVNNLILYKWTPSFRYQVRTVFNHWKTLEKRFISYNEFCTFFKKSEEFPDNLAYYCSEDNTARKKYEMKIARVALKLYSIIANPNFRKHRKRGLFEIDMDRYTAIIDGAQRDEYEDMGHIGQSARLDEEQLPNLPTKIGKNVGLPETEDIQLPSISANTRLRADRGNDANRMLGGFVRRQSPPSYNNWTEQLQAEIQVDSRRTQQYKMPVFDEE